MNETQVLLMLLVLAVRMGVPIPLISKVGHPEQLVMEALLHNKSSA